MHIGSRSSWMLYSLGAPTLRRANGSLRARLGLTRDIFLNARRGFAVNWLRPNCKVALPTNSTRSAWVRFHFVLMKQATEVATSLIWRSIHRALPAKHVF